MYIENHTVSHTVQAKRLCSVGCQLNNFFSRNNISAKDAPVNDHRAIGVTERLKQTNMNRLACFKEEKSATNLFHIKQH